jgi:SAM-dependent methyltransferase
MGDSKTGQVSEQAAMIYEAVYLPALFEEWCPLLVRSAGIETGDRVIDIACGTGALTLAAASRAGSDSSIVGIDINDGMLNVARSKSSAIDWRNAPAEALPFTDGYFDRALCQFGLMYFDDREGAIAEMMRVLRPAGTLAVIVWDSLDNNPGLAAEERLWCQLFGEDWSDETPYSLGDQQILAELFRRAGVSDIHITTHQGTARFESIESWIHTGAKGWTEDDALDDEQLDVLLQAAERELSRFRTAQGTVSFPTSAHIVACGK